MGYSLLPKDLLKTAVLIGTQDSSFHPLGTGFLLSYKNVYLLVTCKHVAEKDQNNFHVLFNSNDGKVIVRPLSNLKKLFNKDWIFHEKEDIAVIVFGVDEQSDALIFIPESFTERYNDLEVGDDCFFLGYPMGITGKESAYPLARSGIISTKYGNETLLIDGNAYPGNSGGPIFLKPSAFNYESSEIGKIRPPKLMGMLFEVISYQDVAISQQTQQPRVIFSENASLAKAYSVDKIFELLNSPRFQSYLL